MSVVYELEENVAFAVGFERPCLFFGIEVEAYARTIVAADYIVALAVAAYKVLAILTFDYTFAFGHRVRTAPEFDAVEHKDIGESAYLVYGKYPECEEYELVEEFVAYVLVPAQKTVGE